MITAKETKNLKKIIGFRHIAQIQKYLVEQGVKNRYDLNYSTVFISAVFNGKIENKKVEDRIWELANIKSQEAEALEARKKAIVARHKKFTADKESQNEKK